MAAARARLTIFVFTVFFCFSIASAQISTRTAYRLRSGTSLPSTCVVSAGDVFFLTSGNVGIYACTSTDTWAITGTNSIAAGITASTTQTQGQEALTANINQVSVVANDDDTVTLPSATSGLEVLVINDGANALQIFPASGDDLGLGIDSPLSMKASNRITFVAYNSTNWAVESSTFIAHGEMHDTDNTDAFAVSASNNDEAYHSNGLVSGELSGWAYDAGGGGTAFSISSIADAGGGDVTVATSAAHGLAIGAIISQANLTDAAYEGIFQALTIPTTTTYTVSATFTATDTGTMQEAATLTADAIAGGAYIVAWAMSATTAANNDTFDFHIYINATRATGTTFRNRFGNATDIQSISGVGIITVVSGDKVSFIIVNATSAGDITVRNLALVLHRL